MQAGLTGVVWFRTPVVDWEGCGWKAFSMPFVFCEYDYDAMKNHMYSSGLFEQLMQNRFHPKNIDKFEDWGFETVY